MRNKFKQEHFFLIAVLHTCCIFLSHNTPGGELFLLGFIWLLYLNYFLFPLQLLMCGFLIDNNLKRWKLFQSLMWQAELTLLVVFRRKKPYKWSFKGLQILCKNEVVMKSWQSLPPSGYSAVYNKCALCEAHKCVSCRGSKLFILFYHIISRN